MPFDSTPAIAPDPTALFRQRREAAAALWAGVPVEQFAMLAWECGTTACALGWLAHQRHDGWYWCGGYPVAPHDVMSFEGAASYFGLSLDMTHTCFGCWYSTSHFHGRAHIRDVTPTDVARSLLALPYAVKVEA